MGSSEGTASLNGSLDEAVIREIVSSELTRHFARMERQGGGSNGEPTLTDILGGIGYIIGLVGLGTFFHYRRKIKDLE